ncbi:MAG: NADH-quinone oxidoreductase subunit NuoF [Anaerolineae bacterium]|nr:NADH-quinone oxidoreductase subunit NuoF [Anaerolineae bacterium]
MLPEELERIVLAEQAERARPHNCIRVCTSAGCLTAHSNQVKDAIKAEIDKRGLSKSCRVKGVGCMGLCSAGPLVSVEPDDVLYQHVTAEDAPKIVKAMGSHPVHKLECPVNIPFFRRQTKIVLENSGRIDPTCIEDYLAAGGYSGLRKVLETMTPTEVIHEISRSGLRGRGGAGYLTGLKWSMVAKYHGEHKFVICNADEGDPGAFMDRSVLESDPQRVIEGMAIAAYAIGADQGYIYIRAEYPLAIERLTTALQQAEQLNLIGTQMFDSPFSFTIHLRVGAGAYVCGEETALIASIEGKRGTPRPRPPYPSEAGLWGCPTLINNVETYANVPSIIRSGAEWFAGIGTAKSKGTKVFSLTGQVVNNGVIEVPMGMSLREIIFDIGGGIPDGRQFKAVQTGGPTGGCVPAEFLDTPVDYESLIKLGTIMGSGGMIIMDDSTCMVDVARYFMEFCRSESCGKCTPCRVGTAQMYDLLDSIASGTASMDDLALLERLCNVVKRTSLCGLGQSAPNPILSTLRYFREEYVQHIEGKSCEAHVCPTVTTEHAAGAMQEVAL